MQKWLTMKPLLAVCPNKRYEHLRKCLMFEENELLHEGWVKISRIAALEPPGWLMVLVRTTYTLHCSDQKSRAKSLEEAASYS